MCYDMKEWALVGSCYLSGMPGRVFFFFLNQSCGDKAKAGVWSGDLKLGESGICLWRS